MHAHGTVLSTRACWACGLPSHCFHSRPPTPVINRQIMSSNPCPLLLPQLLDLISVICPSRPTNSSALQKLAICCSSCQWPNHHNHSPPIVPAPAPHILSNHSAHPKVSPARQPGPLLRPPPFEGRLISWKPSEASRRTFVTAIRSLAGGLMSSVRVTRACRHTKKYILKQSR